MGYPGKYRNNVIAALREVTATYEPLEVMLQSFATESEGFDDLADWLNTTESFWYLLKNAPFKKWELTKVDPLKLRYHHTGQDEMNMEDIRQAKRPDDLPPIIVDEKGETVDGAHRLRVAQEDGRDYIHTWKPLPSSRMTKQEVESLKGKETGEGVVEEVKNLTIAALREVTADAQSKILKKAEEVVKKNDFLNCRLFTQLVTDTPKIESQPRLKDPETGAILWWGTGDGYRHCAVALDDDTAIQVPEWGGKSEVVPITEIEQEYGPVDRIYKGK